MNKKRFFLTLAPWVFLVFFLIPGLVYGQACSDPANTPYISDTCGTGGSCVCSETVQIEGDACAGGTIYDGLCGGDSHVKCCVPTPAAATDTEEGAVEEVGTGGLTGGILPACISDPSTCGLCDMVQTLVNLIQFMAGGVAAFALLFFVIGGFYWIFSMGNEQRVATGKKIMVGSVTGVVIVFLAWIIVNTVILTVSTGGEDFGGEATIFPYTDEQGVSHSPFEVNCTQYEQ